MIDRGPIAVIEEGKEEEGGEGGRRGREGGREGGEGGRRHSCGLDLLQLQPSSMILTSGRCSYWNSAHCKMILI